jgi:branched-chain amino acid transport system substrate-binding protein
LPASLFLGNVYNISPAIPQQLGQSAEGFRAIQVYSNYGADIPAMKDIEAFKSKNEVAKQDVYYMKGWFEGMAMAKAIENAVAKAGGKVPDDLKALRKSVRDEMEGLKNLDAGGIVPPADYANHQGTTQARIAEIKSGTYVATGEWIDAR